MSLPIDIFSWRLHYPGMVTNSSWCYKTFFWGNLDFPKIKKLKKVCSDVWTCTKMWEQCYFQAKLYSKAVYCFEKGLFMQFWLKVKSRFSRFPPKRFYNINNRMKMVSCPFWFSFTVAAGSEEPAVTHLILRSTWWITTSSWCQYNTELGP